MTISPWMAVSIKGGTQNGWFIRENRIKMDDLVVSVKTNMFSSHEKPTKLAED